MPRYLVESYATGQDVEQARERARRAAELDAGVRYVRTTFLRETRRCCTCSRRLPQRRSTAPDGSRTCGTSGSSRRWSRDAPADQGSGRAPRPNRRRPGPDFLRMPQRGCAGLTEGMERMEVSVRGPVRTARRCAPLVALTLVLAACLPAGAPQSDVLARETSASAPSPVPPSNATPQGGASAGGASPGSTSGIARLGQLTDPLPNPLPFPANESDQAAKTLTRQVLAAGDDALPALLTALQASGIAVRGPNDQLIVRPAEPWQGLIVESWEVRTLLAMVLPERTVSMTVADLAELLRAAIPELQGAPVEQLLVADIRTLAREPASPKQFWARYIIELGRASEAGPQADLMSAPDVASIQVNGLQTSLILRRLALDFLMLGGTATTGGTPRMAQLAPSQAQADTAAVHHEQHGEDHLGGHLGRGQARRKRTHRG